MSPLPPSVRPILVAIEIFVQSALLALALASLLHHSSDDVELHRALPQTPLVAMDLGEDPARVRIGGEAVYDHPGGEVCIAQSHGDRRYWWDGGVNRP